MARPRKTGLDYFPCDTDFFERNDMVCIAGEFGPKGVLIAFRLLCAIYRNGYFAVWDEALKFSLLERKALEGVSPGLLERVVHRLAVWGFFDKNLLSSASVLTSREIQERYFAAKRLPPGVRLPYCLIAAEGSQADISAGVSTAKTPVIAAKTPVFTGETPLKKSKVKKSTTTDKGAGAGPGSDVDVEEKEIFKKRMADARWMERMGRVLEADARELTRWMEEIEEDWRLNRPLHSSARQVGLHLERQLALKAASERKKMRGKGGTPLKPPARREEAEKGLPEAPAVKPAEFMASRGIGGKGKTMAEIIIGAASRADDEIKN